MEIVLPSQKHACSQTLHYKPSRRHSDYEYTNIIIYAITRFDGHSNLNASPETTFPFSTSWTHQSINRLNISATVRSVRSIRKYIVHRHYMRTRLYASIYISFISMLVKIFVFYICEHNKLRVCPNSNIQNNRSRDPP